MSKNFKKGEIVYFKTKHIARYTTGNKIFDINQLWVVLSDSIEGTAVIGNGTERHFLFSSNGGYDKLIHQYEWRDLQIGKFLN